MSLGLTQNFFQLLGLPQQFVLDGATLSERWRAMQAQVHPDLFTQASEAEKRLAMQLATRVNEAYETLKHPLKRAQYLCELQGQALGLENNTAMPAAFLMQQMEWREALEDARAANDESVLLALQKQVQTYAQQRQSELAQQLDETHNVNAAAALVRELLFVDKFSQDLDAALDRLYS